MIAWQDGVWLEEAEVRVSVRDPGFTTGHGVFESVRLHEGRWFRPDAHLERLVASAELLRVPRPPAAELRAVLDELRSRSGLSEASARITLTPGAPGSAPSRIATIAPVAADWRERAARGWRLVVARARHPSPDVVPPQLKSLGRVYSVLARQEAKDAGADDALLLLSNGVVAEGPTWNFFFRADGALQTAAVEAGVLPGVTRNVVLQLAADSGLEIRVGAPDAALLERADAAFATMSSLGVVPVVELDGRPLSGSRELAAPLQERYWSRVRQESTP